jgi:FkbM family methyltransferase
MTISTSLRAALVPALRLPGPHVPGWFPLVADRVHRFVGPSRGVQTVDLLGSCMELDLGEYMQRRFYYRCYEAPEVRFFRRWLRPGDMVVDAGAHVGLFTLLAGRLVAPTGEVHAFEPVPINFERLAHNVTLNGLANVRLNPVALGDTAGDVILGLDDERLVGESTCDYTIGGKHEAVRVPVETLDSYLGQSGDRRVRLAKIDVEGFESRVIKGLGETLLKAPPEAIMFEINAKMLLGHGSSPTEIIEELESHGYRLSRLGFRGTLRQAPGAEQLEAAAEQWDFDHEPKSKLRVGLGTRDTLFNAVAIHATAGARPAARRLHLGRAQPLQAPG